MLDYKKCVKNRNELRVDLPVAKTSFNLKKPAGLILPELEDSDPEDGKASNRDSTENDGSGRLANAVASLDMKMSKGVNRARWDASARRRVAVFGRRGTTSFFFVTCKVVRCRSRMLWINCDALSCGCFD